jgi:hypothetical protein
VIVQISHETCTTFQQQTQHYIINYQKKKKCYKNGITVQALCWTRSLEEGTCLGHLFYTFLFKFNRQNRHVML